MDRRELLIGCGNQRVKLIKDPAFADFVNVTTLDIDPNAKPDVLHDLEDLPLPFDDDTFDEIHAYEVLEHTGRQGDWRFFFAQFSEFWRILKPNGFLAGTSPAWNNQWAWGDPGHTRIIGLEQLTFLSQAEYKKQVGKTHMTDYRHVYKADFHIEHAGQHGVSIEYGLRAIKPSRGDA